MKFLLLLLFFLISSCKLEFINSDFTLTNIEVVNKNNNESSFIIKQDLERKFNKSNSEQAMYKLVIESTSIIESSSYSAIKISVNTTYKFIKNDTGKILSSSYISKSIDFATNKNKVTAEYIQTKEIIKNLSRITADEIYNSLKEYSVSQQK